MWYFRTNRGSVSRRHALAAALGLIFACVSATQAGDSIAVIVSPKAGIDGLTSEQVRAIYLSRVKVLPSGESATPVDQKASSAIYKAFAETVLRKTPARLKGYWAERIFSGRGEPPRSLANDAAVKAYVGQQPPGVIGYIDSDRVDASVKPILIVPYSGN